MAATEVLWALSGRQFGECSVTVYPCPEHCDASQYAVPWGWGDSSWPHPALVEGTWYNLGCAGCGDDCSCNTVEQFVLPGPVSSITEVRVDNQVVPTGSYRLDNHRFVVRTDGGTWPICNDGGWSVTLVHGAEVPSLGLMAAAELACEFVKACTPGVKDCRLPQRVVSMVRQGVSQQFLDPNALLKDGKIGLYLSDLFIQSTNPSKLASRPRVYSPDAPLVRVPSV
jgi:hypothetical protein